MFALPIALMRLTGPGVDAAPTVRFFLQEDQRAEGEELFYDVVCDGETIGAVLPTLNLPGRRMVSLKKFGLALGFRLHYDGVRRRVTGFLRKPSERLSLELDSGHWRAGKRTGKVEKGAVIEALGELFVDQALFEKLADVSLIWKDRKLAVEVNTTHPLSLLVQRLALASSSSGTSLRPPSVTVRTPYRLVGIPSLDAQLFATPVGYSRGVTDGSELSLAARGDLLFTDFSYQVIAPAFQRAQSLYSLGRTDPNPILFGPLGARQATIGRLLFPAEPLLTGNRVGVGGSISSYPPIQLNSALETMIGGVATPNSCVELYRGDLLLAATVASSKRGYVLTNVPILPGRNRFLVVIIDPSGDATEQTVSRWAQDSTLPAHGPAYSLSVDSGSPSALVYSPSGPVLAPNQTNFLGQLSYAIGPGERVDAKLAAIQTGGSTTMYGGASLAGWLGRWQWQAESLLAGNGSTLEQIQAKTPLGNGTLSLSQVVNARPGTSIADTYMTAGGSATELQWQASGGSWRQPFLYSFGLARIETVTPETLFNTAVAGRLGRLELSNSMNVSVAGGASPLVGLFEAGATWPKLFNLRADLGYQLGSGLQVGSTSLILTKALGTTFVANLTLSQAMWDSQAFRSQATVYRLFGPVAVGLDVSAEPGARMHVGLALETSVAAAGEVGGLIARPPGSSAMGRVRARVFLDMDGTRRFRSGEPLIAGVRIVANGRNATGRTDRHGSLTLDGLPPNQPVRLEIDEDTLADPSWISGIHGLAVVTRPGEAVDVDLPVEPTQEVSGILSGGPAARVQLVHGQALVASTQLDEDGSFVFPLVLPGTYEVVVTGRDGTQVRQAITVKAGQNLPGLHIDVGGTKS